MWCHGIFDFETNEEYFSNVGHCDESSDDCGHRPELIRLSRIIPFLDRFGDHMLVHTGQNYDYELNEILFEILEIRPPDHYLEAAGKTAAKTIGRVETFAQPT